MCNGNYKLRNLWLKVLKSYLIIQIQIDEGLITLKKVLLLTLKAIQLSDFVGTAGFEPATP